MIQPYAPKPIKVQYKVTHISSGKYVMVEQDTFWDEAHALRKGRTLLRTVGVPLKDISLSRQLMESWGGKRLLAENPSQHPFKVEKVA